MKTEQAISLLFEKKNLSDSTTKIYRRYLKHFSDWYLTDLTEITEAGLNEKIKEIEKQKGERAAHYSRVVFSVLSNFVREYEQPPKQETAISEKTEELPATPEIIVSKQPDKQHPVKYTNITDEYRARYEAGERISEIACKDQIESEQVSDILRISGLKGKLSDKYRPDPDGDAVKNWMKKKRITGAEIARQTGLSPVTVSAWINGREKLKKISDAFRKAGMPEYLIKRRIRKAKSVKRSSPMTPHEIADKTGVSLSAARKWKAGLLTSAKIEELHRQHHPASD